MVIGGPKKNKNDGMTTYNFFFLIILRWKLIMQFDKYKVWLKKEKDHKRTQLKAQIILRRKLTISIYMTFRGQNILSSTSNPN